jgi:hypothetical protein
LRSGSSMRGWRALPVSASTARAWSHAVVSATLRWSLSEACTATLPLAVASGVLALTEADVCGASSG